MTQVTWSNDRGGSGHGDRHDELERGRVVLQSGPNVLTVTARDAAGNTSTDTLTVTYTLPLVLDPMPLQAPALAGAPVTYTATAHNGINTQFKWFFGDGSESPWLSSPSVTHTFASASIFWLTVTRER